MYCIDVYLFTVGAIEVTYINIRYAQWINMRISACWELLLYHVPDSRTPQLLSPHTPGTLVQGRVEGVGNTIAYRCLFLIIFAYICHVCLSYHVCNLYITCILYVYIYSYTFSALWQELDLLDAQVLPGHCIPWPCQATRSLWRSASMWRTSGTCSRC